MSDSRSERTTLRLTGLWSGLFLLSILVGSLLAWLDVPAAFFVGSVLCGIAFSLAGARLTLPRRYFQCAQVLIGCAAAKGMTPQVLGILASNWLVLLGMVFSSVLAGGLVGWFLTRWRVLPGNTAAWGSSPGGASAMVAMAESYGADARTVAMMQYLRVLSVVLSASLVAHWLSGRPSVVQHSAQSLAVSLFRGDPAQIALTLAIMAVCGVVAVRLRIPAGPLLLTMIVGAVLNSTGIVQFRLPDVFQIVAAILIGWFIGLGFSRDLLYSTLRKLHWLFLSSFSLIGLCAFFAWLLHHFAHCDSLTAYLATTPGGLDSVILMAMGSDGVDVPFVVTAQALRLFVVILLGPLVARWICRRASEWPQSQ